MRAILGAVESAGEWWSWPQAAELVGCPVPTIDWYVRQGRIKHRAAHGKRPSLDAASVVEFGAWWRQRQAERAEKLAKRRRRSQTWFGPPDTEGWVSLAEAAEILGVAETHVPRLIDQARLRGVSLGHRRWVHEVSVDELARARQADAAVWVSHQQAADIVGCSAHTILRMARAGRIERREAPRAVPSLRRSSVEEFAHTWKREHRRADRR